MHRQAQAWTCATIHGAAPHTAAGTGKPCRKWAIRGGSVRATHGGSLKAVKHKAKERREAAADRTAKELSGIALGAESQAVKPPAIRDALDRSIGKAPTTAEIGRPSRRANLRLTLRQSREESAPAAATSSADGRGEAALHLAAQVTREQRAIQR